MGGVPAFLGLEETNQSTQSSALVPAGAEDTQRYKDLQERPGVVALTIFSHSWVCPLTQASKP